MWKRLNHSNIVPFRGVKLNSLQLISEWMPGGELREYIRVNQPVDLVNLVGPFLLTPAGHLPNPLLTLSCWASPKVLSIFTRATWSMEISKGYVLSLTLEPPYPLRYFQPNIMVDALGNARITDFGLAAIIRDPNSRTSATDDHHQTPRWTAPEILQSGSPTKESDVFSFGMVIIEVAGD